MKKLLFILLGACLLSSCKSEYEKKIEQMSLLAKREIENKAFKSNSVLNILEFKPLRYDTVTVNVIDTIRLIRLGDKISTNIELAKNYRERAQLQFKEVELHKEIGFSENLIKIEIEEGKDFMNKAKEYLNKADGYLVQDSIIRDRITKRDNIENIYRFSLYLKATELSITKETSNYIDTLTFYFDKNMNLLNINNY